MAHKRITKDVVILAVSVLFALYLVHSGVVEAAVAAGGNLYVAAFVAGIFFTSVVTTAPAVAVLGTLGGEGSLLLVALVGALGAVIGDYILFAFMRDRVESDVRHMLSKRTHGRLRALLRRPTFKLFTPFVAGLLIAIPLPTDELAMSILAMSKLPNRLFLPLAYSFNVIGIYCICLVGHALF